MGTLTWWQSGFRIELVQFHGPVQALSSGHIFSPLLTTGTKLVLLQNSHLLSHSIAQYMEVY